jgi:hypothetical protein
MSQICILQQIGDRREIGKKENVELVPLNVSLIRDDLQYLLALLGIPLVPDSLTADMSLSLIHFLCVTPDECTTFSTPGVSRKKLSVPVLVLFMISCCVVYYTIVFTSYDYDNVK